MYLLNTIDLQLEHLDNPIELFGTSDTHLKMIENELDVSIITRGESIRISGAEENIHSAANVIKSLHQMVKNRIGIGPRDVSLALQMEKKGTIEYFGEFYKEEITRNSKGKPIRVKTLGQREYVQAIKNHDLVFGIGPAGTGKTYLAVVLAVHALKNNLVKRIILTRPAVEAGESLGFLPGDLKEKVDPYLRPLYDALHDILGGEHTERMIERGIIEIAPLAYMRGRTLDDAFVILDEAQNTTAAQMKMFLTRLGFGSKMVITGDRTQIDLPRGVQSGLITVEAVLKKISGISFIYLEQSDVVRHPLVAKIITAYEDEVNKD
ncbi:PhoH family protein [Caldibacillus lycopersici]|uniref:PhoH-like protein n=1 Tax=Perspicuibacillus lycopersici TaxID=1325689 RepID=A0AAE3LTF4_9BACI|nr:PhoH family protein [Perspicuibacillus lycopersici]MCU9613918.1 PhoH family protein [Perspicuibacillus lycopersici]